MMIAKHTTRTSRAVWQTSRARQQQQRPMASLAVSSSDQNQPLWSSYLSFTSPDADFCGFQDTSSASQSSLRTREWSQSLSFASPENDFLAVHAGKKQCEEIAGAWSGSLSMVSPEVDFTAEKVQTESSNESSTNAWSYNTSDLSFASPESDFAGQEVSTAAPLQFEWSRDLSLASPESDFMAADVATADAINLEWNRDMSFASPESDFTSVNVADASPLNIEFSQQLSFASPEADFSAEKVETSAPLEFEWSDNMSLASPEADYTAQDVATASVVATPEWSQALSFASPEADFTLHQQHIMQVAMQGKQAPLPRNMSQAMRDSRAVVVTSAVSPFKVVSVNDAWVGLCGYTQEEAVGRSIGELLQGQDTDSKAAHDVVMRLHKEDYAETVLQNYTKEGREFRNMLRTAPLLSEDGTTEHFVAVLHELQKSTQVSLSQS